MRTIENPGKAMDADRDLLVTAASAIGLTGVLDRERAPQTIPNLEGRAEDAKPLLRLHLLDRCLYY